MNWEIVIGLEVHVQLRTREKLFCPDATTFGAPPNTQVCPVCLGLPGALPVINAEAVDLAIIAALGLSCTVHTESVFARKSYFYPDLPKGYQITQFEQPLATDGILGIGSELGGREIRIRRVHMEEDAGKSIHDRFSGATAVDLNRAGVPLIEIVTEPDLRTPAEARAFLQGLKRTVEYLEVSDCNMEEGSLRVDANVSLRPAGSDVLGVKTEVKNLNSFSAVEKALIREAERQEVVLRGDGKIVQETLLWDERDDIVRPMRSKEESHDYRYFPDPDLPPLRLDPGRVDRLREALPELPAVRERRLVEDLGLPEYDAGVLTSSRAMADYFEQLSTLVEDPKLASNWIMGPLLEEANRMSVGVAEMGMSTERVAELIGLVRDRVVSGSMGKKVLARMIASGEGAKEIVGAEGLSQVRDSDELSGWVDEVVGEHADEVGRYRAGETRLLGYFIGQVMKKSGGRADPTALPELIRERLSR